MLTTPTATPDKARPDPAHSETANQTIKFSEPLAERFPKMKWDNEADIQVRVHGHTSMLPFKSSSAEFIPSFWSSCCTACLDLFPGLTLRSVWARVSSPLFSLHTLFHALRRFEHSVDFPA